jgi:hypothetical protein
MPVMRPVRLETLRKYGFTNVGSVYNSTSIALEKIPGISLEAAQSLKSVADQMYLAVAQSIAYGIDLDDLSTADNQLIESLQGLDLLRRSSKNAVQSR